MKKNGNPIPSPGSITTFVDEAANPVNIEFGPDGNLYYVDFDGGTIRKVEPAPLQPPPSAYLSDLTWTSMTNGFGPVEEGPEQRRVPRGRRRAAHPEWNDLPEGSGRTCRLGRALLPGRGLQPFYLEGRRGR